MQHKKIVKREDGKQYQICVDVFIDVFFGVYATYQVNVYYRQKGKRKWFSVEKDICDHEYRSMTMEERRDYDDYNNLRYVTNEEIYEVKIELWNILKPKKDQ